MVAPLNSRTKDDGSGTPVPMLPWTKSLPQSAEDHRSPTALLVKGVLEGAVKLIEIWYSALPPPRVLTETPLPVATSVPAVNVTGRLLR